MRAGPLFLVLIAAGCSPDAPTDRVADTDADQVGPHTDVDTDDADSDVRPPVTLVLNEVDCRGAEWVEVVALGGDVDLSGWTLVDAGGNVTALPEIVVREGGRFVIDTLEAGLDCDGDALSLRDAADAPRDEVTLPPLLVGRTWGRLPDTVGAWAETTPTRQAANAAWAEVDATPLFDPLAPFRVELTLSDAARASLDEDRDLYVEAGVRLTAADGAVLFDDRAAVRLKGQYGSARSLDGKAAFKVDLAAFDAAGAALGVRRLTLNNQVQDDSKVHEWLAYDLLAGAGAVAPRVGFAQVLVNGEDFGVYLHVETFADTLIDRTWPSTAHLYEGAYGDDLVDDDVAELEVDVGSKKDRSDLQAVVDLLDDAPAGGAWAAIADHVDADRVVAALAVETWIGHWDGYGPTRNNYSLHLDDDGVLTLLVSGTDQTFDAAIDLYDGKGRLLQACLDDAGCWLAYTRALARVSDLVLDPSLMTRLLAVAEALRPLVEADPRREGTMEDFDDGVDDTIRFLRERLAEVRERTACELDPAGDVDGDGAWCGRDCDEDEAGVFRGATEVCDDGIDQDCDGTPDQPPTCDDCKPVSLVGLGVYAVCPWPRTWTDARDACLSRGMDLVAIDSADENARVSQAAAAVARADYWIGRTDKAVEGTFVEASGPTSSFTAWAPGEPNDAGGAEDCAHFWAGSPSWNDERCSSRRGAICEAVAP